MDLETLTPWIFGGFAFVLIGSFFASRYFEDRKAKLEIERETQRLNARIEFFTRKYGCADTAKKIAQNFVWQGETEEQLRDSLGTPLDVDQKVMKSKKREVWKYNRTGAGRYATRITLEDGLVVGWDSK